MAASTTVFSTTPIAGISLSAKGSAGTNPLLGGQALLETVFGNDGHTYRLGKSAASTIGSITTVAIGPVGSLKIDAGSAGFTLNAPGGIVVGQMAWAKKTTL